MNRPITIARTAMRNAPILLLLCCSFAAAQRPQEQPVFTRADTLRGTNGPLRTCYDVRHYHLDVTVDPAKKSVGGSNTITFTVDSSFDRMQVDLFRNMEIGKITLDSDTARALPFEREFNAVFIRMPGSLEKGSDHRLRIEYSGNPVVAERPPWEGGFTWTKDSTGGPWAAVTCQNTGASLWWPNKDHQADKPDSMLISVTVPESLMDVSNGRLRAVTALPGGWKRYDWAVSYPINNYCVTVNVGRFAHFSDRYGKNGSLALDYYVLPENLAKARKHFAQVKKMLDAFTQYFVDYPFVRDGYKLVECPHTGMEHQSAVAYGNLYIQGYRGHSSSAEGVKFDFIIVHESAHEWWGNSVTAKDIADMWIHESFGAYAEALYVERFWGRQASLRYINGKKQNVRNTEPIIGVYNVQHEGSGDMYDKGQLVLNTLRSVINDDRVWFSILKGLQEKYRYQTISAEDIIAYVNGRTGTDLTYFFDQYLRHPGIPRLDAWLTKKGSALTLRYRWAADVPEFRMPVKVTTAKGRYEVIRPTTKWQTMKLGAIEPEEFRAAEDLFYITVRHSWSYIDPAVKSRSGREE